MNGGDVAFARDGGGAAWAGSRAYGVSLVMPGSGLPRHLQRRHLQAVQGRAGQVKGCSCPRLNSLFASTHTHTCCVRRGNPSPLPSSPPGTGVVRRGGMHPTQHRMACTPAGRFSSCWRRLWPQTGTWSCAGRRTTLSPGWVGLGFKGGQGVRKVPCTRAGGVRQAPLGALLAPHRTAPHGQKWHGWERQRKAGCGGGEGISRRTGCTSAHVHVHGLRQHTASRACNARGLARLCLVKEVGSRAVLPFVEPHICLTPAALHPFPNCTSPATPTSLILPGAGSLHTPEPTPNQDRTHPPLPCPCAIRREAWTRLLLPVPARPPRAQVFIQQMVPAAYSQLAQAARAGHDLLARRSQALVQVPADVLLAAEGAPGRWG